MEDGKHTKRPTSFLILEPDRLSDDISIYDDVITENEIDEIIKNRIKWGSRVADNEKKIGGMRKSETTTSLQSVMTLAPDGTILRIKRNVSKGGIGPDIAMLTLVKGLLGTGLLGLPYAFSQAGLWFGFVALFVIISANTYCMRMIVTASHYYSALHKHAALDYGQVVHMAFADGPSWLKKHARAAKTAVDVLNGISALGACCVYFVFLADNLHMVVYNLSSDHKTTPTIKEWMIIIFVPIVLGAQIRRLNHLAPLTFLATIAYFTGFLAVVYQLLNNIGADPASRLPAIGSMKNISLYFGTVMFAFEAIPLILPIENRCKDPKFFIAYNGCLNTGCIIVMAIYATIGFFGYLKYGANVTTSITLEMPDSILYQIVLLLFCFAVMINYMLQLYVPMEFVERWLKYKMFPRSDQARKRLIANHSIRIGIVIITLGIAIAVPHLDLVMSFTGAFSGGAIALIIPPIIYTLYLQRKAEIDEKKVPKIEYVVIVGLLIFGFVGWLCGTVSSVIEIIQSFGSSDDK